MENFIFCAVLEYRSRANGNLSCPVVNRKYLIEEKLEKIFQF